MDNYLILKLIHILSATVLAGTGIGIAFFMFMVNRTDDKNAIAITARHVVLADWLFTAPAVVIQFISGIMLMDLLNYSYTSQWFFAVTGLFLFVGCCWIPVVVIQYKLRELAKDEINETFKRLMRLWTTLGIPAFIAVIILFWLMVMKPLAVT